MRYEVFDAVTGQTLLWVKTADEARAIVQDNAALDYEAAALDTDFAYSTPGTKHWGFASLQENL